MTLRIADIVRAWKDPEFRDALSDAERMMIPDHPAGCIELPIDMLDAAVGGSVTNDICYTMDVGVWCQPTMSPPQCS